jgi:hypothetical protein
VCEGGAEDELPRRICPLLAGDSIVGFIRSVKLLLGIEQNIVAGGMQRLKAKVVVIGWKKVCGMNWRRSFLSELLPKSQALTWPPPFFYIPPKKKFTLIKYFLRI